MAGERNNAPRLSNRKETPDKRISVCTDCRYGIFVGQNTKWTGRGLVHTHCENLRVANEAEAIT